MLALVNEIKLTIRERIRLVRFDSGLNMTEFGERLGLSYSYISLLEGPRRPKLVVPETTLRLIMHEFGANIHWLRTGEGEMYKANRDNLTAKIRRLTVEELEAVEKMVDLISHR